MAALTALGLAWAHPERTIGTDVSPSLTREQWSLTEVFLLFSSSAFLAEEEESPHFRIHIHSLTLSCWPDPQRPEPEYPLSSSPPTHTNSLLNGTISRCETTSKKEGGRGGGDHEVKKWSKIDYPCFFWTGIVVITQLSQSFPCKKGGHGYSELCWHNIKSQKTTWCDASCSSGGAVKGACVGLSTAASLVAAMLAAQQRNAARTPAEIWQLLINHSS